MSDLLKAVLKANKSHLNSENTTLHPPSIRELSYQALKAISSLEHNNHVLSQASSNLADLVNRASGIKNEAANNKADSKDSAAPSNDRYKTELCRKFMENSSCPYARKCQFSHGYHELRPVSRHPRYRTELCREFFNTGLCTYGTRCNFIHYDLPNADSTQLRTDHSAYPAVVDSQQCLENSERPYTPNNDSGFSFGSSNPSYTSTPSSIDGCSPIESTRISDRSDSPNELYAIPEETMLGSCSGSDMVGGQERY